MKPEIVHVCKIHWALPLEHCGPSCFEKNGKKTMENFTSFVSLSSLRAFLEDKIKEHESASNAAIVSKDESWLVTQIAIVSSYKMILQWLQQDETTLSKQGKVT